MKSFDKKYFFTFLFFIVTISIFFVECTPEKKFKILSVFFDGVPDPNKKKEVEVETTQDWGVIAKRTDVNSKPDFYEHPPFAEEKCRSCHAEGFSNALIKPPAELCYTCHEDFNSKYQMLHGPVASGNCLMCHGHHKAKFEKILEREGQQLCLFCHNSEDILKNKKHATIGTKNCTECHNPHGGDNRGMLKPETCYKCHDDFNNKYNFLHGPVSSGNCTACHGSHSSETPKLLVREKQQLCLFCHNIEQVFNNIAHKKVKKNNCTECHNPHGGEDRSILLESIRPYTTKVKLQTKSDSVLHLNQDTIIRKDSAFTPSIDPSEHIIMDSTKERNRADSLQIIHVPNLIEKDSIKKTNNLIEKTTIDTIKEKTNPDSLKNKITIENTTEKTIPDSLKNKISADSIKEKIVIDSLKTKIKKDSIIQKSISDSIPVKKQSGNKTMNSSEKKAINTSPNNKNEGTVPENETSIPIGKDSILTSPVIPIKESSGLQNNDTIQVKWSLPPK